jgi:hypothetical protein
MAKRPKQLTLIETDENLSLEELAEKIKPPLRRNAENALEAGRLGMTFEQYCKDNCKNAMRGTPIITAHCAVRARQRGCRHADFEMVESTGSWMREGVFVRRRDVESKLHRLSAQLRRKRREGIKGNDDREIIHEIERLQRLPGTFIPVDSGHALSIYRPSKRRLKRILRGGRMRRRASRRYAR